MKDTRRPADVVRKTRLHERPRHLIYLTVLMTFDFNMLLRKKIILFGLMVWSSDISAKPNPDLTIFKHTSNTTYDEQDLSGIASIFSPRMDFDQWKPLTGRGDPLRNDPTYDYEPPVLERVHYWAEDSRLEHEKYPERKSEVLVLGVSSRKPSVSRPSMPPGRAPRPPSYSNKYEDFTYKFGEHYPMTILVPPPPPPAGQKPPLFILHNEKLPTPTFPTKFSDPTLTRDTTTTPELITSYAFQESNLVYQASTLKQNWFNNINKTTNFPNNTVSSDYAGWGPTTPFEDNNDSNNIISHIDQHNIEFTKQPLSYYKPMFSQAPPSPQTTEKPLSLPPFLPTSLPPVVSTFSDTKETWPSMAEELTQETSTETQHYYTETTTEKSTTQSVILTTTTMRPKFTKNIIDMLGPMISMPMVTDPDRPEDHLYAHASNTVQIFKEQTTEEADLERMQTMQPPPPIKMPESTTPSSKQPFHINPHILNNLNHQKPVGHTHDPYLHMRFTTPVSTIPIDIKSTTETQTIPMYLIIQGHSKVKTYGSKPKPLSGSKDNEITPNETNEVKHLHPIKEKYLKKTEKIDTNRESRAINLKSLVDNGLGSIEIQEADVGIKYDVSDGGKVPMELYRKGIVDNDENDYSYKNKLSINERKKRQINIENMLSIDDSLEEVAYDLFTNQKNLTGISELISQAITDGDDSSHIIDFDKTADDSDDR